MRRTVVYPSPVPMRIVLCRFLLACLLPLVATKGLAQGTVDLSGSEAVALIEEAIRAVLADSSPFGNSVPINQPLHLDTSGTNANLRKAGVADLISRDRPLAVGRAITLSSRAEVLDCPSSEISSRCVFRRPATSIWLGKPERVGGDIAVVVHVMRPAPVAMRRRPGGMTGFSVEVVLRQESDGSWSAIRFETVVAS